ncbi:site-specific tyrosine recombinase XerC [compost metagenome]
MKHKLPHVKLHGLRHTAGMLLRESGIDLKTIQERLRHTKLDTTANIYTHESEEINRAAADSLESLNPQLIKFAP